MKPEAQRIAIAEACGWRHEFWNTSTDGECGGWIAPSGGCLQNAPDCFPDYLNDLNGMIEAIQSLAKDGWRCVCNMGLDGTWECVLSKAESIQLIPTGDDHYGAGDTLALAMAEAFLRTVGKWVEDKETVEA